MITEYKFIFLWSAGFNKGCHRSGKIKILEGQGKVWELYFESGKMDILKKSQGVLLTYHCIGGVSAKQVSPSNFFRLLNSSLVPLVDRDTIRVELPAQEHLLTQ